MIDDGGYYDVHNSNFVSRGFLFVINSVISRTILTHHMNHISTTEQDATIPKTHLQLNSLQ